MFHFHLNHFGPKLPPVLLKLQREGYGVTRCQIKEQSSYGPLWIVTHKDELEQGEGDLFAHLLADLRKDADMRGYIECEYVTNDAVVEFEQADFKLSHSFPLSIVPFVDAPRRADIHIFRRKDTAYDALDALLESVGFYEVLTPEERIWTFLLGSIDDADKLFFDLVGYFKNTSGVSKIEKEIVRLIAPAPQGFPMRPVARPGFYTPKK